MTISIFPLPFVSILVFLSLASCGDEEASAVPSGDPPPEIISGEGDRVDPPQSGPDERAPEGNPAEPAGPGHEEIIVTLINLQKEFVGDLGGMVENGRTTEFVESLSLRKEKMRELLATAEALPEPQPEDRTFYRTAQEAFADQNIALMDRLAAKIRALPEENEIRGVFARLSEDEEMELLRGKFHHLYR